MQLVVDHVVVPDLGDRRRVDVDGHRTAVVLHSVDPVTGKREPLASGVLGDVARSADDERLVASAPLQHVDADAGSAVVVEARVPRLPPLVEPGLRVRVAPEELERALSASLERVEIHELGCGSGQRGALLRSEVTLWE